jgi:hypothetical protein
VQSINVRSLFCCSVHRYLHRYMAYSVLKGRGHTVLLFLIIYCTRTFLPEGCSAPDAQLGLLPCASCFVPAFACFAQVRSAGASLIVIVRWLLHAHHHHVTH